MWVPREKSMDEGEIHHLEELIECKRWYIRNLCVEREIGLAVNPYELEAEKRSLERLYKILEGFEWVEPKLNSFMII